jgi:uncharacterized protein (DUF1697 family)
VADVRVALLRGINVGKAKRVAMGDLRALVESLGYEDVRTLLNSGNVVFTVPAKRGGDPAARIESALENRLGVASRIIVLTSREVAEIVGVNPLAKVADHPSRLLIMVLSDAAARGRVEPLVGRRWQPEALALGARAAYLWCPKGSIDSPLMAAVGRAVGEAGTVRNFATMTKLAALCGEG